MSEKKPINPPEPPAEAIPGEEVAEQKTHKRKIAFVIGGVLVLVALAFWWHGTYYEDTDDAQVDGDLYLVSARVAGQVIKVDVEENQPVVAGQVLAEIDPKDYEVAVDQAEANLASAEADYEQARVNVPITDVTVQTGVATSGSGELAAEAAFAQANKQVEVARADAKRAQDDVERYKPLVKKDVISKQQFDAAQQTALAAQAQLNAQVDAATAAGQRLEQARLAASEAYKNAGGQKLAQQARADAAAAAVRQCQSKLEQAELNLGYTKVTAPVAGIVNKKSVVTGEVLAPGQDLLTLVPLENLWVTADFKETQLDKMHPGLPVDITVDALGGRTYHGKVTQIGGATGSKMSLFPPENATGNYVKVVQRIPVRIDFTDPKENSDHLLRPGYSVEPKVYVK